MTEDRHKVYDDETVVIGKMYHFEGCPVCEGMTYLECTIADDRGLFLNDGY